MKRALLLAMVFSNTAVISGCTATNWINAAGETMKARDAYDKKVMSERLRKANSAAMQKK
ncbi:hypothetical protein [Pseudomonas sp. HN8-3]|uniref:hypothetical protein n=1 Tax=Pseudomonas sp. HN8-3 TaxID=2886361 RepID=UPI001E363977|nr:hypothetical protein [Pseudomonas sp. HN8-3]UEH06292.1 hypothetical protein LJX92_15075 [Pseudomonas sp. HN8-3]